MSITRLDIAALAVVCRFYVVTREQVQRLLFPHHKCARNARKHLWKLQQSGFITKHRIPVFPAGQFNAAPVYYPTQKGAELLASHFDDEAWLAINTRTPRAKLLSHWIGIGDTRIIVEQAIAFQSAIKLCGWVNEWETVSTEAGKEHPFHLQTKFRQIPRLSCSPDAAFMLELDGARKVFYLEHDLYTSSVRQIAARRTPGYAELAACQGHRRHFPETTLPSFTVLFIATDPTRRDEAAKEIGAKKGAGLWLLISKTDLRPERLFIEPITYNSKGEPGTLVKKPADAPAVIDC